jgi:hypothetical protein
MGALLQGMVTGAASGIGRRFGFRLAQMGSTSQYDKSVDGASSTVTRLSGTVAVLSPSRAMCVRAQTAGARLSRRSRPSDGRYSL